MTPVTPIAAAYARSFAPSSAAVKPVPAPVRQADATYAGHADKLVPANPVRGTRVNIIA